MMVARGMQHVDQPRRLIDIENQMPIRCAGLADKVAKLFRRGPGRRRSFR